MEQTLGVSGPQRFSIRLLGQLGALSAGELAERLALHPSTLTGILGRLLAAGFLSRASDPRDGRRAVLRLTDAGRRLDRRQAGTVEAAVRATLAATSARELDVTRRFLERLVDSLERA